MAQETEPKSTDSPAADEVMVTETAAVPKEPTAVSAEPIKAGSLAAELKADSDEKKDDGSPVPKSASFKEETNLVSDLPEPEKKALEELKSLLQAALSNNDFSPPPPPAAAAVASPEETQEKPTSPAAEETQESPAVVDDDGTKTVEAIESTVVAVAAPPPPPAVEVAPEEVSIWGVPLLKDERSDTILLKFLRARDFKVKEAMAMLKNAVLWRKEFGIESLLKEDLGVSEMEKVVFMSGFDKEGHPVCYNVYGEFQNKELYGKAFDDAEKRKRFLRWRIQYLEKGIRELLDFSPTGISTMVQVTDLKNSPGPLKRELRQALDLLQDNYPEFVAKQVFINVPWWYLAFNRMISPFLTQRTKSKFVFAGPSKSAETLFSYVAPERVPVQFGGLNQENDPDFTAADVVNEITMKPSTKQVIEIPVSETCLLVWELRVLGWEVALGAEFVPSSEDAYTVIIQKARKLAATDEPVVKNSFKIGEPGKVIITVDSTTSKKKKLLYRYKAKSLTESI